MTREDIIRMALEVGFYKDQPMYYDESMLEAFAKLISEYERKFYMQLFLDPENQPTQFGTATQEYREQEVHEAKRQEREACAKVADKYIGADPIAAAIRARGEASIRGQE